MVNSKITVPLRVFVDKPTAKPEWYVLVPTAVTASKFKICQFYFYMRPSGNTADSEKEAAGFSSVKWIFKGVIL